MLGMCLQVRAGIIARQQAWDTEYHLQYCFHKEKALGKEWVMLLCVALFVSKVGISICPHVPFDRFSFFSLLFRSAIHYRYYYYNGNKDRRNLFSG